MSTCVNTFAPRFNLCGPFMFFICCSSINLKFPNICLVYRPFAISHGRLGVTLASPWPYVCEWPDSSCKKRFARQLEQDPCHSGWSPDPENGSFVRTPAGHFCPDWTWPILGFRKFVRAGKSGHFLRKICLDWQIWPFLQPKNGLCRRKHARKPHYGQ